MRSIFGVEVVSISLLRSLSHDLVNSPGFAQTTRDDSLHPANAPVANLVVAAQQR